MMSPTLAPRLNGAHISGCTSSEPVRRTPRLSAFETRGHHEATKLVFNEFGKAECRAILKIRTDDLHTNRKAGLGFIDRYGGCGQAHNGGNSRPDDLVEVGVESPVDVDTSGPLIRIVVVREGRRRHRWTEYNVPFFEQFAPLLAQPRAHAIGCDPIAMTDHRTARPPGRKAVIGRRQRPCALLHLTIEVYGPKRAKNGREEPRIDSCSLGKVRKQRGSTRYLSSCFVQSLRE